MNGAKTAPPIVASVRIFMVKLLPLIFLLLFGCSQKKEPYNVNAYMVKVSDIIPIFKDFEPQRVETSFASFIATIKGQDLNIQFSIEEGEPGFDWVLLAPKNIQDQEKFVSYAQAVGFEVVKKSGNGVDYYRALVTDQMPALRVANRDNSHTELDKNLYLALLCQKILTDFYDLKPDSEIGLYAKRVTIGGTKF